jgi:hypothetical protein
MIVAAAVTADLQRGYYSATELGIMRQAAPIELSPDSNYQVSAYPVPGADLAPGGAATRCAFTATLATAPATLRCSRHFRARPGKPR